MFVIKNILRVYQLARHSIINFFFPKKKTFEDDMMESLYSKGYYMCHENDIDYDNLGSIVKKSIQKYFPSQTGDTRLYGIDDENLIIKQNFHKIINNHKYRIKNISTIKKLYLHCTMGGFLQNAEKASSGGGWHRDHHFELFKVMIYLSDVDRNNGPFSYIEKSHSKINQFLSLLIFKLFSNNTTRYSNILIKIICNIFNYKKKVFTGKKGTCIVFNSSGLHRGLEIKNGERIALTAYIYPYTENKKILYERSNHMNIPENLIKQSIKEFVIL